MRVLVLGGTTFIGRRVVERLHGRGDAVLVVHRVSISQHPGWPWTICTSTGKTFCAMRA